MALTLRELLEKQRLEREQKLGATQGNAQVTVPKPQQTVSVPPTAHTEVAPSPPSSPKPEPQGLLARLQKTSGPVAPVQTPTPPGPPPARPAVVEEKPVTSSPSGATNGQAVPALSQPPQGTGTLPVQQQGLPATFTEDETETLKKNLAFLAANLDEKEIIGQVLRTTVKQIQEHPELNAVLIDSDFDLIVAAARRSMKFAVRKKEEKSDKRTAKKQGADELAAFLKDNGIEL